MNDDARQQSLQEIKNALIDAFGEKIFSIIVYGSSIRDDYGEFSDIDVLIIFNEITFQTFNILRELKEHFLKKGIIVDFNSHLTTDLPEIRGKVFWHNNRGIYVQKEIADYGKVLYGPKIFDSREPSEELMVDEAVKVVSSLNYQARKMLSNKALGTTERITMMKWCIYGVMYVLAAVQIFPQNRREGVKIFVERFNPPVNPELFLDRKTTCGADITDDDVKMAFDFLVYLDKLIFNIYKKGVV